MSAKKKSHPRPGRRTGRIVWVVSVAAILAAGYFLAVRRVPIPDPPVIEMAGLDPSVASVFSEHLGAVRNAPKSSEAWGTLATVYMVYEYNENARMCFEVAHRLDPDKALWLYFGGLMHYPEDVDGCVSRMQAAVELFGDNVTAPRLRFGNILVDEGLMIEAAAQFNDVLKVDPENALAKLGLGKIDFAKGEFEASLGSLLDASVSPYTRRTAHNLLSTVYLRTGDKEKSKEASETFERLPIDEALVDPFVERASQYKTGRQAWMDHAQQLARKNKFIEAKPIVLRVLDEYPETAEAWVMMGQIHLREKNPAAAEDALRKAVRYNPRSIQANVQLGVALMYQAKYDDAIPALRSAIELKPDLPEAYYNMGFCQGSVGQAEAAITSFEEAIRFKPDFLEAYLALANVLGSQGRKDEAIVRLDQAASINAEDPRIAGLRKMFQ